MSSHLLLNLFIVMGFPIHVDTISMGLSILYFKVLANSADPGGACYKHEN